MQSIDFIANHPVFRHNEFQKAFTDRRRSPLTSRNLLARHVAAGRLIRIRRGLYAGVPRGVDPKQAQVDPYLIASHLTDDAVVAFHAALQFSGKSYSVWRRFHYLTAKRSRPFSFQALEFIPVQVPAEVRSLPGWGGGIVNVLHAGGSIRVTTLERTLVDVLNAPEKGGGWEEIWRSLAMIEFFDLDALIAYALALGSALTIARVGFFLEQHRQELMIDDRHLKVLRDHAPSEPRYFDAARQTGELVSPWNIIVPQWILQPRWEECG